jgi:hypothetical protein
MKASAAAFEEIMDESNILEIYIRDLKNHLIDEEGYSPSDFFSDIVRSHTLDRTSEINYYRGMLRGLQMALDIIEERESQL